MVKLENVSKTFGDIEAVKNLNLLIQEGEIFVLLGPTGAGKTTTLKTTAGLVTPDSGRVFIQEEDVTDTPASFRDVSFVFESYNLFPIFNVYDNIAFALRSAPYRQSEEEIRRRIERVTKELGVHHLIERSVQTLSGGEVQRVALARALVRNATVNLFDEPLSNLDLKLREELRVEFKELQRVYEATIFYVTHDHDSAVSVSDRIGVLSHGQLYQVGTPNELVTAPELINYPTVNRLPCKLHGRTLYIHDTIEFMTLGDGQLEVLRSMDVDDAVDIVIRPQDLRLGRESGAVGLEGAYLHTQYQGYTKLVTCDLHDDVLVTVLTQETYTAEVGQAIQLACRPEDVLFFRVSDGARIPLGTE